MLVHQRVDPIKNHPGWSDIPAPGWSRTLPVLLRSSTLTRAASSKRSWNWPPTSLLGIGRHQVHGCVPWVNRNRTWWTRWARSQKNWDFSNARSGDPLSIFIFGDGNWWKANSFFELASQMQGTPQQWWCKAKAPGRPKTPPGRKSTKWGPPSRHGVRLASKSSTWSPPN